MFIDTITAMFTAEHGQFQNSGQNQQGRAGMAIMFMVGILLYAADRSVIVCICECLRATHMNKFLIIVAHAANHRFITMQGGSCARTQIDLAYAFEPGINFICGMGVPSAI